MEYLSFEPPLRRTNRGEIVRTDLASPPRATSLPLSPIIAHFSLSLSFSLMRWRKHKGHRVLAAVANDEALRSLLTGRLETIISREKRAATFRGGHYPRRIPETVPDDEQVPSLRFSKFKICYCVNRVGRSSSFELKFKSFLRFFFFPHVLQSSPQAERRKLSFFF